MQAGLFALIARSVGRKEMLTHPDAIIAMKKEWDRLRDRQVWREDLVEEWSDVKKRFGTKPVHVGDILETCTQKCDELPDTPENKALKKFKGRVCYGGHRVKDQTGQAAMFQEYHSCPAGITSSRACDFYGMLPGNVLQQSDADMAYCQTTFRGTPTYVRLPKHRWPADWHGKYWDPVLSLIHISEPTRPY